MREASQPKHPCFSRILCVDFIIDEKAEKSSGEKVVKRRDPCYNEVILRTDGNRAENTYKKGDGKAYENLYDHAEKRR